MSAKIQRPFTQVGDTDVYVSYPLSGEVRGEGRGGTAPRVVLLFGWMGAKMPQLYRFTEMYHKLYPSATQILVRTFIKSLFAELPTNKLYVLPVVKLLHEAGIHAYDPPVTSGLLVHSISNGQSSSSPLLKQHQPPNSTNLSLPKGGAMAQTYLAHCLSDTRPPPSVSSNTPMPPALPAQALIYDSLPSTISLPVFLGFFSDGIVPPALRLLAKTLLLPAYVGTAAYRNTIDRRPDTFTTLRSELSDARLIPQSVPQVYMYGDADELTPAESVEKFTDGVRERLRAERKGVREEGLDEVVRIEKFARSTHVSHAKNDPKRYWDAVVRTWETSSQSAEGSKLHCKL